MDSEKRRAAPRLTLRLQLTMWFVIALLAVEGTVLFAYWIARDEPLVTTTGEKLRDALEDLRPLVTNRDSQMWRRAQLELLALRADIDILSIVGVDGRRIAGGETVFPDDAIRRLMQDGIADWTLKAVREADPANSELIDQPKPAGEPKAQRAAKPSDSVFALPEWPVVGAAISFQDLYGRRAYLIGARPAPSVAPPTVLRAVLWMALIGLLSATLAAWVVIGRAIRPLTELAESARNISPERREERLEGGGAQAEVDDARRTLNEALDRLAAGYDALDLFIGNVTHELRTPIATVLAEARQLTIRDRTREEYVEFVRSTGDEMAQLGKMIHSFLTLARMDWEERRGMVMPIELFDIALDVVHHTRRAAEQEGVRVVLSLPEDAHFELFGDPELISSMLDNVVRNGIRFSPPGEQVEVVFEDAGGRVRIIVRDHGPGIPEPLMADIFEPFVQGRASASSGRGSGIGLAIAQKVIELHRGSIRIGNHAEGGCEVVLELPLDPPGNSSPPHSNGSERPPEDEEYQGDTPPTP